MLEYKWKEAELPSEREVLELMKEINVNRIVATLLCQRGFGNFEMARGFFRPSLDHLHNPFLFREMPKAEGGPLTKSTVPLIILPPT